MNRLMIDYDYSVIAISNDGGKTFTVVVNGSGCGVRGVVMDLLINEMKKIKEGAIVNDG